MAEAFTLTRIRKDVLKRLREIADANKRTTPSQIEWFVEQAEAERKVLAASAPKESQK